MNGEVDDRILFALAKPADILKLREAVWLLRGK